MHHTTVLLKEAIDALIIDADGFYVDGTFGRGGHSSRLLHKLSRNGSVLAIDKDPAAIASGHNNLSDDVRLKLVHGSFSNITNFVCNEDGMGKVSGVLLDLGVSSPQIDETERGFSFLRDGPLDMRMDTTRGQSAADWINSADESEISNYNESELKNRFVTHDGQFHLDDVAASVIFSFLGYEKRIFIRTRNSDIINMDGGIVFDVGSKYEVKPNNGDIKIIY